MVRGDPAEVDLSDVPRPKGFTFYGSTKVERNSRSVTATATASVTYHPPEDEPIEVSIEKHRQVHAAVLAATWQNAEERRLSIEHKMDLTTDGEVDYVKGKP